MFYRQKKKIYRVLNIQAIDSILRSASWEDTLLCPHPPKDTSVYSPESDAFITLPLKTIPLRSPNLCREWREISRERSPERSASPRGGVQEIQKTAEASRSARPVTGPEESLRAWLGGPSCGAWPDGTAWPPGPLPPPHLLMQPSLLQVQALGGRRSPY